MKSNMVTRSLLATAIGLVSSCGALAADNANHTVGYAVSAINEIAISGNVSTMTVSTATAGSEPDPVTDATQTYDITTNGTNKKITAALDTNMGTGLTLALTAAAPTGASANSEVSLSTVAADVVTGITEIAESGKTLTYKLTALVTAGVVAADTKTVTLTIADGA